MVKDNVTLFIVFATLLGVLLIALTAFAFYHFSAFRKRKQKQYNGSANKDFIDYNPLQFTYDTSVETQQTYLPSELPFNKHNDLRGDASTTSESSFEEFNEPFLKSIDLVQPSSEYQRSKSSSTSGSSELVDVFLVDKSSNGGRSTIRPQSVYHRNGLGKLSISLFYDKALELLRVNVIQWFDVSSHGFKSTISPYVKVQVVPDNDRKFFTKTKGGENPVFDEEFSFQLSNDDLNQKSLHLSVCDFDKFSRQNVLANGVIKLSEYVDRMSSSEGTGEISIGLTESDELKMEEKGEISCSLCYLPTSHRLTLTVNKARGLNINTDVDTRICVKARLLFEGKVLKSRRTSYHQTNIANPIFNESWVFEIPTEHLQVTSIVLSVYAYSHNKKRVVGMASTGPNVKSKTGLAQWNEMLVHGRDPHLHWHKLE